MEFKQEELVEREIEIAGYLMQNFSLKQFSGKTGLSKKILAAHIRNMMEKLKVKDRKALIILLKTKQIIKNELYIHNTETLSSGSVNANALG